jgi:hypothetical protein
MGNLVKLCRAGDRALQLLLFNEEFLVSVSHQLALITSLPFVHTACRYYRLNGLVIPCAMGDSFVILPFAFILLCPLCHCWDGITSTWLKPSGAGSTCYCTYLLGGFVFDPAFDICLASYRHLPSPLPPPYIQYPHTCAPLTLYGPLDQVWKISGSNYDSLKGGQMLISDAHEWINEIPTVPIYYLAKPQPRGRAWQNQRGKKTLLSLTLV